MQRDDGDGEVLLCRQSGGCDVGGAGVRLPAPEPDREHRPAEQGDDCEDREGDPCECVLVADQVDDPDDETSCGEQEVAQDQRRADPVARLLLLAHSASHQPDREQHEAASCGNHPGDERSPLHHSSFWFASTTEARTTVLYPRGWTYQASGFVFALAGWIALAILLTLGRIEICRLACGVC